MEEEYRMQKAQGDINQVVSTTNGDGDNEDGDAGRAVIYEDGTVAPRGREPDQPGSITTTLVDDNASTRGMASPATKASSTVDLDGSSLDATSLIPTIRVSTESDRDREEEDISKAASPPANGDVKQNGVTDTLEKPMQAAASEGEQPGGDPAPTSTQEPFSFSNKRLCERWLDNLFMVLYEVSYGLLPPLDHD
jgi:hypothetical protein